MKPRLERAPLTEGDSDIWFEYVWAGRCRIMPLYDASQQADRRDADLMWRLSQLCPSCQFRVWSWYWSEQLGGSLWQRCRNCGNIRCASQL